MPSRPAGHDPEKNNRVAVHLEDLRPTGIRRARSITRDPHNAEDIHQDTSLQALKRVPAEEGKAPSWYYKVVTNKAINVVRRQAVAAKKLPLMAVDARNRHSLYEASWQEAAEIRAARSKLLKEGRVTAKKLRCLDMRAAGFGWQEVADAEGIAIPTARDWAREALSLILALATGRERI